MNRRRTTVILVGATALGLTACTQPPAQPGTPPAPPAQVPVSAPPPAQVPVSAPTPAQPVRPPMAALGASVRDGNWAFVVTAVKCGLTSLTDPSTRQVTRPGSGQFCVVVVKGTNITTGPQSLDWTEVMLADTAGNSYDRASGDPHMAAWHTYVGATVPPGMDVNPGATGPQVYVYDLPAGVRAASVELHGGPTTGGAYVTAS